MQTKEQFFEEHKKEQAIKRKEMEEKCKNEILQEISDWDFEKLKEEYVRVRLSKISYNYGMPAYSMWKMFKHECIICSLEYAFGKHDQYCVYER